MKDTQDLLLESEVLSVEDVLEVIVKHFCFFWVCLKSAGQWVQSLEQKWEELLVHQEDWYLLDYVLEDKLIN